MKIGFFLPHVTPDIFFHIARQADRAGVDFICCDDHLMSPFSDMAPDFEGCYEAWTAMTYVAGKTEKIGISHMVLIPGFRHPAVLAKMTATLDHLSKGRLTLTVGAGWNKREFEAYGLTWEDHAGRMRRLGEEIRIIKALWSEGPVDFNGRYYTLKKAEVLPKPWRGRPPILVGGDSKRTMALAAELCDGWLMHGHDPDETARMIRHIRPMIKGREDDFIIGSAHFILIGDGRAEADQKLKRIVPEQTWSDFMKAGIRKEIRSRISGTADECLRRIDEYREAGLSRIVLVFLDPRDIDVFLTDVLPGIRNG